MQAGDAILKAPSIGRWGRGRERGSGKGASQSKKQGEQGHGQARARASKLMEVLEDKMSEDTTGEAMEEGMIID
eukprot:1159765-Pelagomonas_calceolata.AAC.10